MATQNALAKDRKDPEFTFYDGPPFATGLPHYGHILAGTIKDTVTRFACMSGYFVERRAGWDCHGLPVEYEIDQKLKITRREQVLEMGVANYNKECRSIVTRYTGEWEKTVTRLGRWIDFKDDYKTMNPEFMESVWWVFSELMKKDLVYQGYKVMPFSTACGTPLSNFEAGLNYKDAVDPAVVISFPLVDEPETAFVAWTTTPWTLPSNLALCVHPELKYIKVKDVKSGSQYILGEARLVELFPIVGTKKFKKDKAHEIYEILQTYTGVELLGIKYAPLFDYFADSMMGDKKNTFFRVLNDKYVTADNGTGIVHQAPAFGEDDYRVCLAHEIIIKGKEIPCPVDCNGIYTDECKDFKGQYVKSADVGIMADLKSRGRLVKKDTITHSYPFCWRSDTPLIYKAVPSWFVKVEEIKDKMMANNAQTTWVPSHVKDVRFNNWLRDARDWAISRNRFWGTPIPVWSNEDYTEMVTVGSIDELYELSGVRVTDLHKDIVDEITIPSKKNPGTVLRRIDEVFDCWFESGSMPYAQKHYPFENNQKFENQFPADFIAEGLDQTRGWFYTLMVLSTALFDKPPFKNVIVNGLVLAGDGKKMSKRLKNYPDPTLVIDKYGADALRMYLINSPVVRAEPLKFQEAGVLGVVKDVFLPWFNAFRFLIQNIERWEGETNSTFVPDRAAVKNSTNAIDLWLGARTQGLIKFVHNEMKNYRLYTVMPELVNFIIDLTNWYVRLNRERMKDVKDSTALQVLYECLLDLTVLMAPFCPFITEYFYQHLRKLQPSYPEAANGGGKSNPVMAGKSDSVHFLLLPKFDESRINETAVQGMQLLQAIVKCGRDAREKRLISLKMPVKKLVVCCPNVSNEVKENVKAQLSSYIMTELNAWDIVFADGAAESEWVKIALLPNLGVLGKKLGKNMGAVKKALVEMNHEDAKAAIAAGKATVAGVEIDFKEEVLSKYVYAKEGDNIWEGVIDGSGEILVAIDTEQDEKLISSGKCRDVMAAVQQLRKKAGLVVGDQIEAFYTDNGAGLEKAIGMNVPMFEAKFGDMLPLPVEKASDVSVVLAELEVEVGDVKVMVDIRKPCLSVGGKVAEAGKLFLQTVEVDDIVLDMELKCTVDGADIVMKEGVDFFASASRRTKCEKR
jgi:isoleucyl-tRNA synthetase